MTNLKENSMEWLIKLVFLMDVAVYIFVIVKHQWIAILVMINYY